MKCIIHILIFILSAYTYAQHRGVSPDPEIISNSYCLDSTRITIRYSFKYKFSHSDKNYFEDIRVLQVGKKVIKEFSEIAFLGDSLRTVCEGQGKNVSSNPNGIFPFELFYYVEEKRLEMKCRLMAQAGVLLYQPEHRNIEWIFSQDNSKDILGYTCNKATVTYAGRQYTAWYTMDVPVFYGPYRFAGLPGMIVNLKESTGMYEWQLISVIAKSRYPILDNRYSNETKTSEEIANKTIRRMVTNPIAFEKSIYDYPIYIMKNGKLTKASEEGIEYQYEPIELE